MDHVNAPKPSQSRDSFDQWIKKIESLKTIQELNEFIKAQPVDVPADYNKILLFSGIYKKSVRFYKIAKTLCYIDPKLFITNNVNVHDYIWKPRFIGAVKKLILLDNPNYVFSGKDVFEVHDYLTQKIAENFYGQVWALISNTDELSLFFRCELPIVISNTKVTTINGISREKLSEFSKKLSGLISNEYEVRKIIFKILIQISERQLEALDIKIKDQGKVKLNASSFFSEENAKLGENLFEELSKNELNELV